MNPTTVGVIGCGYWGPNLLRNFVELPDVEVVAVADLDEGRRAAMTRRYPWLVATSNYQDFFSLPIQAAVIATPPPTHYALAKDCLEHGLHVLVEKPITLNARDAEHLNELAERQGLVLMVGHTFEYNPAVRLMKEIIASGDLGDVYYIDTVRVNLGLFQDHLNVLWDLAPHDVSILRYVLGCSPVQVSACGAACIFPDVVDLAYLYLEFPNRVIAHVHVSWLDPCKVRRITVVGSKKMLVYDDVEPVEKVRIYDKGIEKPSYTHSYADFQLSYRNGDVLIPHLKLTEPLRIECQHFVESIVNGTTPLSSGRDGLEVVRTLEMADSSLRSNGNRLLIHAQESEGGFAVSAA